MIKSTIMRWAGHVARMGEMTRSCRILVGDLRERDHLEVLGIDWRIILKWIFMKWDRDMEWNDMAQKRERWLALVNVVMNIRFPYVDIQDRLPPDCNKNATAVRCSAVQAQGKAVCRSNRWRRRKEFQSSLEVCLRKHTLPF